MSVPLEAERRAGSSRAMAELRSPQLWAVAATFGAISMMWTTYNEYVPQFLGGVFGLPLVLVTLVLTLDNLLGLILEPVTGLLSDQTRTRWGKRLPWILIIAPIAAASLALIPFPASRAPQELAGQTALLRPWLNPFLLFVIAMLIAMALFRTPAVALMPDLVTSPERSAANGLLQMLSGIGSLGALIVGDWLMGSFGPTAPFLLASGVMLLTAILLWRLMARERPAEKASAAPAPPARMGHWGARLRLLGAIVLWWLGFQFFNTFFARLAGSRWGFSELAVDSMLQLFLFSVTLASIPAGLLAKRRSRRTLMLQGTVMLLVVVCLVPLLPPARPLLLLLLIAGGIGWAGVTVNSLPMLLDLGPEGRHGTSTGLYYLAFALSGLMAPWLVRLLAPALATNGIWLALVVWALTLPLIAGIRRGLGEEKGVNTA